MVNGWEPITEVRHTATRLAALDYHLAASATPDAVVEMLGWDSLGNGLRFPTPAECVGGRAKISLTKPVACYRIRQISINETFNGLRMIFYYYNNNIVI